MFKTFARTIPVVAVTAALSFSTTTHAGKLYDCNVDDGCRQVDSKFDWWRSSTQTKNPVVFVHGLSGWSSFLGIDYFYGIGNDLMRNGTDMIFQPAVSGNSSAYTRGEQLLTQLESIEAVSGKRQFNFIGHSQGAPTSRYIMGVAPEKVASITTVGGVNWGSRVADDIVAFENSSGVGNGLVKAFYGVFEIITTILGGLGDSGDIEQNAKKAMESLTTESTLAFNQKFPVGVPSQYCGEGAADWQGKKLYSFSGTETVTNLLDFTDIITGIAQFSFRETNEPNDGLVSACSSHFGKVLRDDYPLNHLDEANLFFGMVKFGVDPKAIYRLHVNRLKRDGV